MSRYENMTGGEIVDAAVAEGKAQLAALDVTVAEPGYIEATGILAGEVWSLLHHRQRDRERMERLERRLEETQARLDEMRQTLENKIPSGLRPSFLKRQAE